uniref:Uncharacterized protein n=1 Tax=viral metagenome TaxID=1070528 RepID=A0A6C0BIE7_9ZZZZ
MSSSLTRVLSMIPRRAFSRVLGQHMPLQLTLWTFPWELKIGEILMRDVVNSLEFREQLGEILDFPGVYTVEVHTLEHDYHVSSSLEVVKDEAILVATYKHDEKHCDCGKPVENGRMTCLCWADEEDLARMDRDLALHRY